MSIQSFASELKSIIKSLRWSILKAGFNPMQPRAEDGEWIDSFESKRLLDLAKMGDKDALGELLITYQPYLQHLSERGLGPTA